MYIFLWWKDIARDVVLNFTRKMFDNDKIFLFIWILSKTWKHIEEALH